ncbi:MAG TPA: hypothetical protein VFA33_21330 [Bryobacteraceae bacterium]|nr:hypothetical protein [Bryobacteraceae bacterium]
MALDQDIEQYIRQHRESNSRNFLRNSASRVTLLAELHVGHRRKAQFLAGVIGGARSLSQPRFFASEHFINDAPTRVAIQNYLYSAGRRTLPPLVIPYQAVLDAARTFPGHAYAVLTGGSAASAGRNGALHAAFTSSVVRQNTLFANHPISLFSRGQFLLGAAHAARRDADGSSNATTCELLRRDGWTIQVVRFTVNVTGNATSTGAAVTIQGGESISVEPLGGGTTIDLLPMLNRIGGGSEFHVTLRAPASPFAQVRSAGGADIPFNSLFDYLLHLP